MYQYYLRKIFILLVCAMCDFLVAQNADINWLYDIQQHRSSSSNHFFEYVSYSVYPVSVVVPVTYFSIAYLQTNHYFLKKSYSSAMSLTSNFIITMAIKYMVHRERPYQKYNFIVPLKRERTPSFPSGHTSIAFHLATILSLEYPKWYVILPCFAYASLVGFSRLYLGVHYPSDVIVGSIVGSASAYLSFYWYKKHFFKQKKIIHMQYD